MTTIRIETAGRPIEFEIGEVQWLLEDETTEAEIRATLNLATQGERGLKGVLKALKNDGKSSNQLAALKAIESLHEQKFDVSSTFKAIAYCVEEGHPMLANAAMETIANLAPEAVQWMVELVQKKSTDVPDRLCETIARQAGKQELMELIHIGSKSRSKDFRDKTASIIDEVFVGRPELASQEMVEILYQLQSDAESRVRGAATLGLSRAPENVKVDFGRVIQNLNWDDDPFGDFSATFKMIGAQRARARSAIPALLELRRSPPSPDQCSSPAKVRVSVTETLCMIEPDQIRRYLNELVDFENAVTSEMILFTLEREFAAQLLGEWLEDKRPNVVETAIATAGSDGFMGAAVSPRIAEFLKSTEKNLQLAAAKALRDMAKLLGEFSMDFEDEPELKKEYKDAVAQMKRQLGALRKVLPSTKTATRKMVEGAIKRIEGL